MPTTKHVASTHRCKVHRKHLKEIPVNKAWSDPRRADRHDSVTDLIKGYNKNFADFSRNGSLLKSATRKQLSSRMFEEILTIEIFRLIQNIGQNFRKILENEYNSFI